MPFPYKARIHSNGHCAIYENINRVWEYSKSFSNFEDACEYYKKTRNIDLAKVCQIINVTDDDL